MLFIIENRSALGTEERKGSKVSFFVSSNERFEIEPALVVIVYIYLVREQFLEDLNEKTHCNNG